MKSVIAGEYTAPPAHGPENGGDLRHDARGERVAEEDVGVAAQRDDAFLDARAAGVVEADHRRAVAHREIHHLADLLGERLGERAAEHGEVLREDVDEPSVDAAVAGDDAVAEELLASPCPKSVEREVTNRSSSTKLPSSSSRSRRSRAESFPFACCASRRAAPPPSSDDARRRSSSSSFSRIVMEWESSAATCGYPAPPGRAACGPYLAKWTGGTS